MSAGVGLQEISNVLIDDALPRVDLLISLLSSVLSSWLAVDSRRSVLL